jgi:hypothetical protein
MSNSPSDSVDTQTFHQADLERITQLVASELQIQETTIEQGIPTYYLLASGNQATFS